MEQPAPNTSNFLDWVEIKNFKSIKDLRLDCKRVNIFIGKPNVGKSNILEALGMLGNIFSPSSIKTFDGTVRYVKIKDLFNDSDTSSTLELRVPGTNLSLKSDNRSYGEMNFFSLTVENYPYLPFRSSITKIFSLFENGKMNSKTRQSYFGRTRKYEFSNMTEFKNSFPKILIPPHGSNLYEIVNNNTSLWDEFAKLFQGQGLEFILSSAEQTFVLQKKVGSRAIQYPFFSIADTFRRYMFYIAAIESNTNSVLIFEEPEVHSFPPYTQDLAYRMIYSETNQFFISTHSPYLLQTLVGNLSDDQLQVFVTYYDNYETKVKALTPDELGFVQEYSTDVFFNLDRFIPNAQSASVA